MNALAFAYRAFAAKAGPAEPIIHASLMTYASLLLIAATLNSIAPQWASRNTPPVLPVLTSPSSSARDAGDRSISRCVSRGLLFDINENPVIDRVKAEMNCGCRRPEVYEPHETPTVCAILQSFNHEPNIRRIAHALKTNPSVQEIIICEDGSKDSSLDRWMEELRDHKHFIVLSNDLHETRCYNRAMRMSSAEYFVLMQDDDLPPPAPSDDNAPLNWVSHALELFDADPKLGVLGGFIGQMWGEGGVGFEFGEQTSDHGGSRQGKTVRIPFLSPRTLHPFMYVECAWIAPLFIRSEALHRMGGLDVGLFRVREPGVWQDCVLSYATWNAGWRVGVFDANFERGVGGHGSTSSPAKGKMRAVVWSRAKEAADFRYDRSFIHNHCLQLNQEKLTPRFPFNGSRTSNLSS